MGKKNPVIHSPYSESTDWKIVLLAPTSPPTLCTSNIAAPPTSRYVPRPNRSPLHNASPPPPHVVQKTSPKRSPLVPTVNPHHPSPLTEGFLKIFPPTMVPLKPKLSAPQLRCHCKPKTTTPPLHDWIGHPTTSTPLTPPPLGLPPHTNPPACCSSKTKPPFTFGLLNPNTPPSTPRWLSSPTTHFKPSLPPLIGPPLPMHTSLALVGPNRPPVACFFVFLSNLPPVACQVIPASQLPQTLMSPHPKGPHPVQ